MNLGFAFPYALVLLPLPVLVWVFLRAGRVPEAALAVPRATFESALPASAVRDDRAGTALLAAAWTALVVALAGPQIPTPRDLVGASGREILLAIDLSGSMTKEDFFLDGKPLSRLDAVKRVASRFVAARRGDRIGLVIFGDRAYVAQPPTFDVDAVARSIEVSQIGISGRSTAISDGLGLAAKRLSASDARSKVIVLLSDGVDTSGKVPAADAAALAAEHGIRVHTIALGPADLETQPKDRDAVDAATLRAVAEAGGGTSFRVRTMDDLEAMAATLDKLEPNPMDQPPVRIWLPLWTWPAAAAAVFAGLTLVRRR
jgi:Ca-activated chloride channel family protein